MPGRFPRARLLHVARATLALVASTQSISNASLRAVEPALPVRWDQPNWTRPTARRDGTHDVAAVGEKRFIPGLDPLWVPGAQQVVPLDANANLGLGAGINVNRVDGFSLLSSQVIENRALWLPSLSFYEGYGAESKRWSGACELRFHPGVRQVRLGARWADETSTWFDPRPILTAEESLIGASLLREDFSDYTNRRSSSGYVSWNPTQGCALEIVRSEEEHRSLDRTVARYGPFGGRKRFRANPEVEEGDWSLLRFRGVWSKAKRRRLEETRPSRALLVEAQWAGGRLGSGRAFTRLWAEHRGSLLLSPSQSLGYRVSGGFTPVGQPASHGSKLPIQWRFRAGGIGSLRGHRYQKFSGDRLALGTVEYEIESGGGFKTTLFVDSGLAWNESADLSGGVAGSGPLALDGGVGVTVGTQGLRVDVARDLRRQHAPARITARLSLPY